MPELETSPSSAEPTSDAVILFTDIVDSLRTQSGIGTDLYAPMLDRHNVLFKGALSAEGGRVLQHTGDGYLAMLEDPAAAVRVALAFQAAIRAERWTSEPLRVRAALAAGKVSLREDPSTGELRAEGIATNIAGRLLGLAMPDQILMTGEVFDAARVAIGEHPPVPGGAPAPEGALEWLAHGPYIMQGIEEPVGVFEAGVAGSAPLCPPEQSDKASRNIRKEEEATLGWRPAAGREVPGRGDWVLAEKLGAGSFGEVWRAENAGAGERRVFKFCFEPERLRSLRREAELVAHIRDTLGNRDDIAPLFSAQVERPPFFLEGPFIGGGNLSDWITAKGGTGEVALEDRLRLFAQVARAVGAAHSVGIIHKDIKPSNILVQEAGGTPQAILADFGIGKLVGGDSQGTLSIGPYSYDAAGARLYMAPEYMTGAAPSVQGDIYALGVLLFQLVTGDLSAPAAQGWERRIGDDILRADIAACIDEDPALRPPSADEVAKRIEALAERRAAAAAEQAAAEKARRARRLRVILAISAGAFAVIAGFLAWLFIAESKHLDEMTAANERNEQLAYGFGLRRAHELIEDRIPAEARKVLEALPERRRSTGWQSLKDRVDPPRQWIALPDSWREPEGDQLMPRGRSVANRDRSLIAMVKNRVITVASMDPVEVVAPELVHPAEVTNCAFLPQADYLLSLDVGSADSPPRVWGWRIGEWKPVDLITLDVELPDAQLRNPLDLVVGNSGKNVVVVYDGKLVGYQVIGGGGKPVSLEQKYEKETSNSDLILNGVHNGTAVSAAAEADLFVAPRRVGGGKKVMHAYRMSDGALTAVFDRGTDEEDYGFYDSQITADGNFISAIATKFTVLIDNRDRENPKKRFRSLGNNDTSFSGEFSPDGRIYMEINAAGYLRFWDPVTAEVVSRIEVPGAGSARRGAFSPDGSMVGSPSAPTASNFAM
ncbi:MAG: protein kinase [Verrucomicrobiales bacterium]